MSLRIRLILTTTAVVTVLFGISEWLSYQQTAALLAEHEAILIETSDHTIALRKLQETRGRLFVSVTTARIVHAVLTLLVAVAVLNYVWYRVIYRPIRRLLSHINSMSRGTWHSVIPVKRRDEIGELTCAFNELGQQLTSSFQHINAASRLSAFALIGRRMVRRVTSIRSEVAAAAKCFGRGTDTGHFQGMEILGAIETQLDRLEDCFQQDFDDEFSATSRKRSQSVMTNRSV